MSNVNAFVLRRSFLVLLFMYCCVTATLPLSGIHLECLPGSFGFVCGGAHQKGDIHVRLHELLFSHFNNKSDHLRNVSFVQLIKNKTGGNKNYLQPATATDTSDSAKCFSSQRLTADYDERHIKLCLCCSASGLSPPSV